MKTRTLITFLIPLSAFTLFLSGNAALHAEPAPNTLSAEEKAQGWKLLFDGKKIEGWRLYDKNTFPTQGWVVEDGTLHKQGGVRGGNIMTVDSYKDFEFSWDWKMGPEGNNGVKYFIIPQRKGAIGHEYQMVDDAEVKDSISSNASFYLIVAPKENKPGKAMGEWNRSKIIVKGNHVEHWLNGEKVLEYECGSPAIMEQASKTKFKKWPDFGKKFKGHILLTDHKDPCWFRNLKIRVLD